MIKYIIYFSLILVILGFIVSVGIIFLPIIALVYFAYSYLVYSQDKELKATKMECPNCGSNDIKIHSLKTGYNQHTDLLGTGDKIKYNFFGNRTSGMIHGKKDKTTHYNFKREGICKSCGFNFDYLTNQDVEEIKNNSKIKFILSIIFLIISVFVGMRVFIFSNSNNDNDKSIWAKEYTSIKDFDYYLDGDNIYLKDYKGSNKKIKINSTYEINGKNYNVVEFSEGVFALDNVFSVILPDTLKKMPSNTFNSSNIKYLYIPKSIETNKDTYDFYDYFHNVEKIYYGGSEDEWKNLTKNVDRSKIDAKEIIYNANSNELK